MQMKKFFIKISWLKKYGIKTLTLHWQTYLKPILPSYLWDLTNTIWLRVIQCSLNYLLPRNNWCYSQYYTTVLQSLPQTTNWTDESSIRVIEITLRAEKPELSDRKRCAYFMVTLPINNVYCFLNFKAKSGGSHWKDTDNLKPQFVPLYNL